MGGNSLLIDPVVSISKCSDPQGEKAVEETVQSSIDLLGGLNALIMPGDTVLIKPNLVDNYEYKTGATTNPYVVRTLVRMTKQAGAKKVIVADGSRVGLDTEVALAGTGMRKACEEMGAEVRDLKKDRYEVAFVPNGRIFRKIRMPQTFFEADIIINVPVMKTHDCEPVTLGLKNMKGLIHERDKKRFHRWGLTQSVLDLNKIALPHLTVLDGTVAMEGAGPLFGTPVHLGLIVASFNTLAADTVAAAIMGYSVDEIPYLKMAEEQGLGVANLKKIQIVGEDLKRVKRPFKRIDLSMDRYKDHEIKIFSEGACSGCNQYVESFLLTLEREGRLGELAGSAIIFGQTVKLPEIFPDDLIRIGTCTRKMKGKGECIPGCPPHPVDFRDLLERRAKRKIES